MTSQPDLAPVFLTDHAVARFRERSIRALGVRYSIEEARKRIVGLLARVEPDVPDAAVQRRHMAMRTRKHREDGREPEYWRVGGWRFVVIVEVPHGRRVLVTCERVNPGENF